MPVKIHLLSLVLKRHACQNSFNCQAWRNSPRPILANALCNRSPSMLTLIWCMYVIQSYHTHTVPDSTRVPPPTSPWIKFSRFLSIFVNQATPWLRQLAARLSSSSNLDPSKWDLWYQVVWKTRFFFTVAPKIRLSLVCDLLHVTLQVPFRFWENLWAPGSNHTQILLTKVLCSKLTKGGGGSTWLLSWMLMVWGGGSSSGSEQACFHNCFKVA
jgi:hypothetical protein